MDTPQPPDPPVLITLAVEQARQTLAYRHIDLLVYEVSRRAQAQLTAYNQAWAGLASTIREFTRRNLEHLQTLAPYYEPLTALSMLCTLIRSEGEESDRAAAVQYLARRMRCGIANPRAYWTLVTEANTKGLSPALLLRDEYFPSALFVVASEVWDAQTVRLKRRWIKDETGHKAPIIPMDLPLGEFIGWYRQRAYAHVEMVLGGRDHIKRNTHHPLTAVGAQSTYSDPIDLAVTEKYRRDRSMFPTPEILLKVKQLAVTIESALSPRQKEIMQLREAEVSYKEIANLLGMAPSTVRQHVYRVRRKYDRIA